MSEEELKPCPFCGGEAELEMVNGMAYRPKIKHDFNCYLHGYTFSCYFNKEKAIKAWNTRNSIENIVKGLEERKNFYENRFSQMSGTDRDVEDWGSIKSYEDAIQIVKRGIVSDDDVCEWHKTKNNNAYYKCNTHSEIHDSRVLDWCKCPYCGKKIKVVE